MLAIMTFLWFLVAHSTNLIAWVFATCPKVSLAHLRQESVIVG